MTKKPITDTIDSNYEALHRPLNESPDMILQNGHPDESAQPEVVTKTYEEIVTELDFTDLTAPRAAVRFVDAIGGDLQLDGQNVFRYIAGYIGRYGFRAGPIASGMPKLVENDFVELTVTPLGTKKFKTTGIRILKKESEIQAYYADPENKAKSETTEQMIHRIAKSYAYRSSELIETNELESALTRVVADNEDRLDSMKIDKILNFGIRAFIAHRGRQINRAVSEMHAIKDDSADSLDIVTHATALRSIEAMLKKDYLRQREVDWLTIRYGLNGAALKSTQAIADEYRVRPENVSMVLGTALGKIQSLVKDMQQTENKIHEKSPAQPIVPHAEVRQLLAKINQTKINGISPVTSKINVAHQTVTMIYALPTENISRVEPSDNLHVENDQLIITVRAKSDMANVLEHAPKRSLDLEYLSLYDRLSNAQKAILRNIADPHIRTNRAITQIDSRGVQKQINELMTEHKLNKAQLLSLARHLGFIPTDYVLPS